VQSAPAGQLFGQSVRSYLADIVNDEPNRDDIACSASAGGASRTEDVPMIERLQFGRTGHPSTRVIFGAAGLGRTTQDRADAILQVLLEFDVNHIDTAAAYGDSELRIAPWMREHRDRFFLATKTGDRTGAGARASLERSLERLGVDRVDLIQLHNLVEPDEWETAHGPGGAVEALAQARAEGLTRFIGVTGHGLRIPEMHVRSLERFDFDSVLVPWNFALLQIDSYRHALDELLSVCHDRNVAVQTIKSVARRRWQDDEEQRFSWYEPILNTEATARAVLWVLARPDVFVISSSDARVLRPILDAAAQAAEGAGPPSETEMRSDVDALQIKPLFDGASLERI
jgi:aryl-alcohol dehydrogenase-like predicted oxidoreductase